jgi:hypothetical protein
MRRIIFALFLCFSTAAVFAQGAPKKPLELAPDAPERHVVVRGDTLWGISSKFLKDPFRWPELWGMNKDEVKNPHLIFPGQILILDLSGGDPRLKIGSMVKLGPQVRVEVPPKEIPAIPARAIEPFLSEPLVIETGEFNYMPRIVATQEDRVFTGTGDAIFATPNADPAVKQWQVFRPGKPLVDPDNNEVLGIEAIYLGNARPNGPLADVLPMELTSVKQEIGRGDYLVPAAKATLQSYVPHAPTEEVRGRVMGLYNGVGEGGATSIVSISRGKRDGLEVGHVLALYRAGATVTNRFEDDKLLTHTLPDERYGLVFIFRVFDKVSYALVTTTNRSVFEGDRVQKP